MGMNSSADTLKSATLFKSEYLLAVIVAPLIIATHNAEAQVKNLPPFAKDLQKKAQSQANLRSHALYRQQNKLKSNRPNAHRKVHSLEFDPDHINVQLGRKRVMNLPAEDRVPAREGEALQFDVGQRPPKINIITDNKLYNCIRQMGLKEQIDYIVYASPEEAQAKCRVSKDDERLEWDYQNTCIQRDYGGSAAFQNCYISLPHVPNWKKTRGRTSQ